MGRKRKGKAVRAARRGAVVLNEEEYKKCPHSFVFHRGEVGKNIGILAKDMKRIMEPYTATKLKVRRRNVLQDYVNVAGPMNISHFIIFTKTKLSNYMRVLRLPRGPTLTFKINNYSLCRDVISSIKRHNMEHKQFLHHPLLVMNGFGGEENRFKLMTTMFQNLFPSITINKLKLSDIRRCVLLNYSAEDETIELRQFNIKAVPVGMSRGVKKLIKARIPDMGKYDDVSELLLRGGDLSESEAELDGPHNEVILPQNLSSRGNMKASKSAIRLTETGPRLTLQLIKIEDGVCQGEVLYHSLVNKTEDEIKLLQMKRHKKKKLKERRTKEQDDNIKRKEDNKLQHKKKCLDGMQKTEKESDPGFEEVGANKDTDHNTVDKEAFSSDDDISYYRKEVGEDPDPEMFPKKKVDFGKRKRSDSKSAGFRNKRSKPTDSKNKDSVSKSNAKHSKKPLTQMETIKQRKDRKQKLLMKKTSKNRKGVHNKSSRGRRQ